MKKITFPRVLLFAFLLILIFTFVSCNGLNNESISSNTEENSPTEQQLWLPYTMLDHLENCKYTYYYDEYGNEIKTTKEDLNGNLQATWFCEYDDDQNLIKRSVDTGNGTLFVQLIMSYDDKGNLTEKREFSTGGETVYTYQYDEQNRLASESSNGTVVNTYTYETDGSYKVQNVNSVDEYSLYHADGKIKERHRTSKVKWVYSYNSDGVLVECDKYSGEDITQKTVYHLDENGNTVKLTQMSDMGKETLLSEYEYKQYTVKAED